MKKPALRVIKWLGQIPVEAMCNLCPAALFQAKGTGHRPNLTEYQQSLQRQFDLHVKTEHGEASLQ